MADFNDFLALWLLRRLRRRASKNAVKEALEAYGEDQQALVQRLKATAEARETKYAEGKARHDQLKSRFRLMKENARTLQHQVTALETEMRVLREQHEQFQQQNALVPRLSEQERADWKMSMRLVRKVWRYSMRLGVLRQHEPRPLHRERLPATVPPGSPDSWPAVSIVTPSYQQAQFLERTMRSVLDQDYPRIEYRVIDGGSQDGSVEIIRAHAGKLAGWHSERDSGPASAVNRGFAESSGEIMGWLNSDDMLRPGTVRYVANYFARHPDVDVVYGNRLIVDERDWQVGRWVLPPHDGATLLWEDFIPQETMFWRRRIWDKAGARLDESYTFAFDWDLLLRFQKAGARMVRLPWFLGCFRVHDAQKSSAEISTVGRTETDRLRERELGSLYNLDRFNRRVVLFQRKALWCDRLLRWGVRW